MNGNIFQHGNINFSSLRKRAYNMRWAQVEKGVIPLTAADPDFCICPQIKQALHDYIKEGVMSYGPAEGLPEFRKAIAKHMVRKYNVTCESEHVFAADSAASAMYIIAKALLKPGDEVIIFDPVDFLFKSTIESVGAKAVLSKIDIANYQFDFSGIKDLISTKTKMISICNPHNPLGIVMSKEDLNHIAKIAIEHDLWILSDEIWSDIIYRPHIFTSMASLSQDCSDRTITVKGFSKNYGLAGLRVGCLVTTNEQLYKTLFDASLASYTIYGVSTLSQIAVIAALEEGEPWLNDFVIHLESMRDYLYQRLSKIRQLQCHLPQGTYVLFPKVKIDNINCEKLAEDILKIARVAIVPGCERWFGPGAHGHFRIAYPTSKVVLHEAVERIEHFFDTYY